MIRMWPIILVLVLSPNAGNGCEYSRTPGLFKNGFTSDSGTDNFVDDTGRSGNKGYGQSKSVKFTDKKFKIFDDTTELDSIKICDNGLLLFGNGGVTANCDAFTGTTPFSSTNSIFAHALWLEDNESDGILYKFQYKHLKASEMEKSGLDHGPSKCDLQRVKNIINDCSDDGYTKNAPAIEEMLIVTWEIKENPDEYYFQAVLAVDADNKTYVVFLYSDPAHIPNDVGSYVSGYITGSSATVGERNAGVCPYNDGTSTASDKIHLQSNCRCGTWNQGIYVFNTAEAEECGMTEAEFKTECSKDVATDNTMNLKLACRPARNLQDTCLETVYCKDTGNGNREINIKVVNPPFLNETVVNFLDQTDFESGTITQETNPACKKLLTQEDDTDVYSTTVTLSDISLCDMTEVDDKIMFVARLYDLDDANLEKAGGMYLNATCDVLPQEVTLNITYLSIKEVVVNEVTGRRVEMFFNTQRYYEFGDTATIIHSGAEVDIGQDLFIAIGYDWGDAVVRDKTEPYGIYAYDCKVANNDQFRNDNDNSMTQLTTADTGCPNPALDVDAAFHMSESFKVALSDGGTLDLVSDALTSTFNFVISADKIDAVKWLVGGDILYAQCKVGFCRNQDFKSTSRCWDTCGTSDVDYAARKRRDTDNTSEIQDPEVIVQASVKLIDRERPIYGHESKEQSVECISNIVAYSTLLGLTVLLLTAMGVTLMLFARLHARQRKRM